MSLTNFIGTVWSETLLESLEKEYVGVKNSNRDFDADAKLPGSVVKACAVKPIFLFNYIKETSIGAPQNLTDESVTINLNRCRAFNFKIEDIDKAQSKPSIMKSAMMQAARALANDADGYIFSLHDTVSSENTITVDDLSADNIIDTIIRTREAMLENNVNSNTRTVLEVSPKVASLILKANIAQRSNNDEVFHNGYVGSCICFDIYVTNNVATDSSGYYKCYARTTRAIAFAEQIKSIIAYRPEDSFSDAVKGLYVYGASIIYPKELTLLNVKLA